MFWDATIKIVGALAALAFVLFLAWLVLRWIGKRTQGVGNAQQRHIKVIERMQVGRNSTLLLLKLNAKVLLVAVSERGAEKLYEFDDEDGKFDFKRPEALPSFAEALKSATKRFGSKHSKDDGGSEE